MRTLTGMVLGCLMINLVIAAAGYLAVRFSWLLANLTAIVLAVAMVFLAFWFQQGSWAWAALIALVAAVLAGSVAGGEGLEHRLRRRIDAVLVLPVDPAPVARPAGRPTLPAARPGCRIQGRLRINARASSCRSPSTTSNSPG